MKLLALLLSATACSLSVNGKGYYGYGYGQSPEEVIPFVPSPEIVPSPEVAPAPVCVPLVCVGDKSLCPIPEYMEGVHPCCDDEACATCHYNGCNQCCVGAFKPSYAEPCQSCCEYDANCMMCSDFIGCQQCSEGYTLTKGDDGFYYCA